MKIYFVRHGETDMNVRNMFYGWYDADINKKGITQAQELREAFRDIPIDAIYSSDLKRALHTAEIIAEGKPIQQMFAFRELYYGKWENRSWEEMTWDDRTALKQWQTNWQNLTMPEGESFMEFYNRVTTGLDNIIKENKGKHILVVSHNGALSAMHCHLTGVGPKGFWNFDSKQGHYSAVWISEKKLTYDCFNYPAVWKKESGIKIYFDCEQQRTYHEEKNMIPSGKQFDAFVMTCEETGFSLLQKKRNFYLIFEGKLPKIDFYPVPSVTIFAHDGNGGYFAHTGKDMEGAIYFITVELECWFLAENFRTLIQMLIYFPNWKEPITGEVFCEEETEEKELVAQFGVERPNQNLSELIFKTEEYNIFQNIEKAKEKINLL